MKLMNIRVNALEYSIVLFSERRKGLAFNLPAKHGSQMKSGFSSETTFNPVTRPLDLIDEIIG